MFALAPIFLLTVFAHLMVARALAQDMFEPLVTEGNPLMIDRTDIGAVVDEMYALISGPAGPRDWSRQAAVFHPQSRQIRTWIDADGKPAMKAMSPEEYAADTTPFFAANPFYEVEIVRRIDVFGNIAHVWSAYEARRAPDDSVPERRGINSIQLFRNEHGHWQIMAMIWDNERDGVEIGGL